MNCIIFLIHSTIIFSIESPISVIVDSSNKYWNIDFFSSPQGLKCGNDENSSKIVWFGRRSGINNGFISTWNDRSTYWRSSVLASENVTHICQSPDVIYSLLSFKPFTSGEFLTELEFKNTSLSGIYELNLSSFCMQPVATVSSLRAPSSFVTHSQASASCFGYFIFYAHLEIRGLYLGQIDHHPKLIVGAESSIPNTNFSFTNFDDWSLSPNGEQACFFGSASIPWNSSYKLEGIYCSFLVLNITTAIATTTMNIPSSLCHGLTFSECKFTSFGTNVVDDSIIAFVATLPANNGEILEGIYIRKLLEQNNLGPIIKLVDTLDYIPGIPDHFHGFASCPISLGPRNILLFLGSDVEGKHGIYSVGLDNNLIRTHINTSMFITTQSGKRKKIQFVDLSSQAFNREKIIFFAALEEGVTGIFSISYS